VPTGSRGNAVGNGSDPASASPTGAGSDSVSIDVNGNSNSDSTADEPAPPGCGDGKLVSGEACDDGNLVSGDGCSANCLAVEPGYSCVPPGKPCQAIAICGDGVVAASEECDDGNVAAGDGCSASCKYEIGFKCSGTPSVCSHTTCGDGVKEGAESCDDGNALPFDGCSSTCQAEPSCGSASGSCTSTCGDGLVIGEECDDGNLLNGDGCSSDCKVEPGYTCTEDAPCDQVNGQCVLRVPVVYHDFNAGKPVDFEVSCATPVPGIVQPTLNDQGLPVLVGSSNAAACIASSASFAGWYADSTDSNTVVDSLVLFDNGSGGFVNRYGPNGEQWQGYASTMGEQWAANDVTTCAAAGCLPCSYSKLTDVPRQGCTGAVMKSYDGTPLFFPLDGNPKARAGTVPSVAQIPPAYGYANWPMDTDIVPGALPHDFSFTTHVVYWFHYDAAKSATLAFTGDDDVWVFINKTLAVDLGGLHPPLDGTVTVDSTTAPKYGLTDGSVYKISVFHAERKKFGSSFRLTLDGFDARSSVCTAKCGDGIVQAGEQCDDGVNMGGYGQCGPGCRLGAFCGDGVVEAPEECDDGHPTGDAKCGSGCRKIIVK
jgi:fibro-slime domain-containing protein